MAKNPLIIGLATAIPSLIQSISSIIKEKKTSKEVVKVEPETTGQAIVESIKDIAGGSISSKRVLNIAGSGLIITLALKDIGVNGITKANIALIGLGVIYSLGMSLITWLSDRK